MPYGTSALSPHILFSEYRGPRIFNELDPNAPPAPPKDPPADPPKDPPKDPPANPEDEFKGRLTALETKNKELKTQLKEFEDAKKAKDDEEAKARGEHEQLAEQYKNESAAEKTAREAAEAKVAKYETQMSKQIDEQIKAISDAEKQKKVKELLGERPVEEKMEMLPNILSLVGVAVQSFGGPTPTTTKTPEKVEIDTKRARFDELRQKTIANTITPAERAESHRLQTELSEIFEKEQKDKQDKKTT